MSNVTNQISKSSLIHSVPSRKSFSGLKLRRVGAATSRSILRAKPLAVGLSATIHRRTFNITLRNASLQGSKPYKIWFLSAILRPQGDRSYKVGVSRTIHILHSHLLHSQSGSFSLSFSYSADPPLLTIILPSASASESHFIASASSIE